MYHSTPLTGLLSLLGLGLVLSARAGTVITANLPAQTAIVNIDGKQDGAAAFTGTGPALWYQPFFTGGATQLLRYTVQPGTYSFRVINPTDAALQFPALSPSQLSGMFTAWTFNSPWTTDYIVFDDAAATNASLPQLFDGAFSNTNGVWAFYDNATNAYNAAIAGGFSDLVRSGPLGRSEPGYTNSYSFTNIQTLIFAIPDYILSDNAGGISVLISPMATFTRPGLNIFPGTGNVALQWTTNTQGFNLEQSTNLQSAVWTVVTNVPVVISTNYSVTLPVDSIQKFFHLHHP